uniref:Uncharacterized protein n=1 Tax=Setaria italica TaxID=4555 RepID=K3ZYX1_SETIT
MSHTTTQPRVKSFMYQNTIGKKMRKFISDSSLLSRTAAHVFLHLHPFPNPKVNALYME